MDELKLLYPVKPAVINQFFGGNGRWYQENGINIVGHNGMDFDTYHGQPVYAAHEGEVVYCGSDNKEGYGVVIRTNKTYSFKGQYAYFKTIYWHLINNIPVRVGQMVKPGDIIGYSDNTGFSTGDHLHFALKPQVQGEENWIWYNIEDSNGYFGAIDPNPYFIEFYSQDSQTVLSILKEVVKLLTNYLTWKK